MTLAIDGETGEVIDGANLLGIVVCGEKLLGVGGLNVDVFGWKVVGEEASTGDTGWYVGGGIGEGYDPGAEYFDVLAMVFLLGTAKSSRMKLKSECNRDSTASRRTETDMEEMLEYKYGQASGPWA